MLQLKETDGYDAENEAMQKNFSILVKHGVTDNDDMERVREAAYEMVPDSVKRTKSMEVCISEYLEEYFNMQEGKTSKQDAEPDWKLKVMEIFLSYGVTTESDVNKFKRLIYEAIPEADKNGKSEDECIAKYAARFFDLFDIKRRV